MKKGRYVGLYLVLVAVVLIAGCFGSSSEDKIAAEGETGGLVEVSPEFPNGGLLVTADSVQSSAGTPGLVIIDARTSGYGTSHIAGAINLIFGDFIDWSPSGLKPRSELEAMLSAAGLSRDMTFVIYDNTTASWGAAGRIFWMLEYLGCTDVHILNGGWDKWVADGRPTEAAINTLAPNTFVAAVNSDIRATSSHIMDRLLDDNFAVIDPRTDEEFLGWLLYGEARRGHIPHAVNIPYAWFFNSDKTILSYEELEALFEARGIVPGMEVTSYCTAGIRSGLVYFLLRLMGYSRCSNYDGSMYEWSANAALPMEKAEDYWKVVYPGWVDALIAGGNPGTADTPPTYSGNGYVIFECSWGATSSRYDAGHIPGAIHFNTDIVENRDLANPGNEIVWNLVDDATLEQRLGDMGVDEDTTVVVYGRNSNSATARVYWALRYAGIDVRYLNGGFQAWEESGGAVETAPNTPTAVTLTMTPQPQLKALTPEIQTYADYFIANEPDLLPGTMLVDVRSMEEYIGAIIGYNDPNITRMGRIPGAVWAGDVSPYYRDADGTLRAYTEVRQEWEDVGITPNDTVIFYCGTGWRSSLTFLYADLMGWPDIKNYDSWYVWSTYWDTSLNDIDYSSPVTDPAKQNPIDTGWPGP